MDKIIFLPEQLNVDIMWVISFLLVPILVVVSLGLNVKVKDTSQVYGFDKMDSQVWKGVAAFVIFLHHYSQRVVALEDIKFSHAFQIYAGFSHLPVGVFFFLSGYSLLKSYMKNQETYLQSGFIRKRLITVFLPFFIVETIYSLIIKKKILNYLWCLLSFHAHDDISKISRPYWFLIAILITYVIFYIGFKQRWSQRHKIAFVLGTIVCYMIICHILNAGFWWYKSIMCFGVGVIIANAEEATWIHNKKNRWLLLVLSALGLGITVFVQLFMTGIVAAFGIIIQTVCFSIFIYGLNDICSPNSFVWRYLGKYSLEIYLTHIFIIRYLEYKNIGLVRFNAIINILLFVTMSFVIGKLVNKTKGILIKSKN